MKYSILIIARLMALILGGFCIYVSLFLYENQEGKLQNKLEDLWIKIDEAQSKAFSKHVAFMRIIAAYIAKGFQRFFGKSEYSIQSIGVSACYAMASIGLCISFLSWIGGGKTDPNHLFFNIFAFNLAYGSIPALIQDRKLVLVWAGVLGYLAFDNILYPSILGAILVAGAGNLSAASIPLMMLAGLLIGVTLFAFFIAVIRKSLVRVSQSTSLLVGGRMLLLNCIPVLSVYMFWRLLLSGLDLQGALQSKSYVSEIVNILLPGFRAKFGPST